VDVQVYDIASNKPNGVIGMSGTVVQELGDGLGCCFSPLGLGRRRYVLRATSRVLLMGQP
jgi:hypothetical protein